MREWSHIRKSIQTIAIPMGIACGLYELDNYNNHFIKRISRVCTASVLISWDYKRSLPKREDIDRWKRSDPHLYRKYKDLLNEINTRTAQRILNVCLLNGGIFVKFGQHLASSNGVLPKSITDILSQLQDQALPVSFQDIKTILENELGKPVDEIFQYIDPSPIAAASIAQVHRGRTNNNEEIAIKIQYPSVKWQFEWDIWILKQIVHFQSHLFPNVQLDWLVYEFQKALLQELNFDKEKDNSRIAAKIFVDETSVYIPKVYDEYSTSRVLTMEYIQGIKVTQAEKLKEMQIDPSVVADLILRTFGRMIYCHGFIHCDPHPGNILIRLHPEEKTPQIVLLDHGLYRQLDQSFRSTFCLLWKSLLMRDPLLMHECAKKLGVENYMHFLPLVFVYRPATHEGKLGEKMNVNDRLKLAKELQALELGEISDFMEKLPRDMLFVLRIMNLVRSLNKELGGTSRQRFRIMGEYAVRGSTLHHEVNSVSKVLAPSDLGTYIQYWWQSLFLIARLNAIDWAIGVKRWWYSADAKTKSPRTDKKGFTSL